MQPLIKACAKTTCMTQELTANKLEIPEQVRSAYQIGEDVTVERLHGGLVNDTLLVQSEEHAIVLRRLSNVMHADVLADTQTVSDHLITQGWEAPTNLRTTEGALHVVDEAGFTWHSMNFIPSDGRTPQPSPDLPAAAGDLLGSWHASMRSLDYQPRFGLQHFHDTPFHASKLIDSLPEQSSAARELAHSILRSYVTLPADVEMSRQLIHGDPKLDNMLFRDGKPFTLIDFDTIMKDSVWTDVGDFLRSLTGKLLTTEGAEAGISDFVSAYREAGNVALSPDHAAHQALRHTGRIALELGMRYLCDIVDDQNYFSWSVERFATRQDNHLERAQLQLDVSQYVIGRL